MSTLRLPYSTLSPAAYQGLLATKSALDHSSLGKPLIELVYLRVSQISGCAFCLEIGSKSAANHIHTVSLGVVKQII